MIFLANSFSQILQAKFRKLLTDVENVLHVNALPQLDSGYGYALRDKIQLPESLTTAIGQAIQVASKRLIDHSAK